MSNSKTGTKSQASDQLPEWDLSDLYASLQDPALERDFVVAEEKIAAFKATYEGKLQSLDGKGLGEAIVAYEVISEIFGRIMSFAGLKHASNMTDPAISQFYQNCQERANELSLNLIFFTLELNRLDDAFVAKLISESPVLQRYRPWIENVRLYRPYQLDDPLERLFHEKEVTSAAAWNRLFDETMASLVFTFVDPETGKSQELGAEEALHYLSDKNPAKRQAAASALSATFSKNIRLFTLITNTLAKDKEIEDKWRNYPSPMAARHLSNQVEPEVVEALVSAVRASYPRLSHRYYKMKAKWMGRDQLDFWDRNAPLPEDDDRKISWDEAKVTVLDAYRDFSGPLADIGERFFKNAWIDVPVRPGKAPGAFAHSTVPSCHPYLLLNYLGRTRDVMTLAHELGHGVHQVLAAPQGALLSDTPLTLAETASVFGEMLTFQALLRKTRNPVERRVMLASKVEDMLNTVVRQIAFYSFEKQVHTERRQGELTAERLGEIWLEVQRESLGEAIRSNEGYENFWCYIPHFIHSPFYVYAYAFGDCLVNSLYAVYQSAPQGFEDKYLDMLRAGGTLRHRELLAPFGLNAADPAFWQKGLDIIAGLIDELETSD
jgi:oligoendopeptidase F